MNIPIAFLCSATVILLALAAALHNRKKGWKRRRYDPATLLYWVSEPGAVRAVGDGSAHMMANLLALNRAIEESSAQSSAEAGTAAESKPRPA